MLNDHLAGGRHCPCCCGTACPPLPDNHQTGRRTVSNSIPMMAPIHPPRVHNDSRTTGQGILPGLPRQLNGHHCCHSPPRPSPHSSSTLPISSCAHPQPATPRILLPSLPPCLVIIVGTIIPQGGRGGGRGRRCCRCHCDGRIRMMMPQQQRDPNPGTQIHGILSSYLWM
jgi:hypothetical protein